MLTKLALGLVIAAAGPAALAQSLTDIPARKDRSAYVQDSHGNIMRTPQGHCWRSALWTPADAVLGCDGDLAPPIAKPTAPPLVAAPTDRPAAQAARCDFNASFTPDALFGPGSARLNARGKRNLDRDALAAAAQCAKVEAAAVEIGGRKLSKNMHQLWERRAAAVAAYLSAHGVPARAAESSKSGTGATRIEIGVQGVAR